jgi:MFS family permease
VKKSELSANRNFTRIVAAAALGGFSAGAANIGLDLVAVLILHASAFQVGLINALGTLSYLLFSIPAGVLIDRWPKRAVMATADIMAGVGLAWVPVAWSLGFLDVPQLAVVTFFVGVASMLFSIANRSVLPYAVPEALLTQAYSRQESVVTVVEIAAPFIIGQVLRTVSAPLVLIPAAIARLISAFFSGAVVLASPAQATEREPFAQAMRTGVKFSLQNRPVRAIVASTALINFGLALGSAVQMLFFVRVIHLSPAEIGFVLTGAGVGAFFGTLAAPKIIALLTDVSAFLCAAIFLIPVVALLPVAAQSPWAVGVAVIHSVLYSIAVVVYNVNSFSLAARLTPKPLLGRQMSFMGFAGMGVVPVGSIVGGYLGDNIGLTSTLWVWAGLSVIAAAPIVLGSRRIRFDLSKSGVPDSQTVDA